MPSRTGEGSHRPTPGEPGVEAVVEADVLIALEPAPQHRYTVAFAGRELWGSDADPSLSVSIEAFEPYLEPA